MTQSDHRSEPSFAGKPPPPPPAPPLPRPATKNLRGSPSSPVRAPSNPIDASPSKSLSGRAAMAARFAAVDRAIASRHGAPETELTFVTCHMFFYGSLMDSQVLQKVANLASPPATRGGVVRGFRIKMWGVYPTAIPDKQSVVAGTVWHTDDPSHLIRLQEYETRAYRLCDCEIELEDGHRLPGSKIFCWAGEPTARSLKRECSTSSDIRNTSSRRSCPRNFHKSELGTSWDP